MEMSLAYAGSPSSSLPQPWRLANPLPISTLEKSFGPSSSCNLGNLTSGHTERRRGAPAIRALKSAPSSRRTLSSNWDISQDCFSATSAPSWMPRLEELDTTNMLLRQRIIFLGSQVDDVTADFIISQLLFLDAEDSTKDITLFINSPGGSVTAGMGIYDAMKLCKADVSTVCLGLAASMGAFLLASGTKGKRFCMPNSRVMIHQPLGTAGGKASEMGIRIREMVYHKIKLNKIFSRITGSESQLSHFRIFAPPLRKPVWDMWKVEGSRKAKKNLPSEDKMLQNGNNGGPSEKETPASV
uniref:ATP-dependent Clp protease proteolytic subunit n=1 Tax=Cannabis sativa TaxID=3483 RepID=A0A803P2H0_CANSA